MWATKRVGSQSLLCGPWTSSTVVGIKKTSSESFHAGHHVWVREMWATKKGGRESSESRSCHGNRGHSTFRCCTFPIRQRQALARQPSHCRHGGYGPYRSAASVQLCTACLLIASNSAQVRWEPSPACLACLAANSSRDFVCVCRKRRVWCKCVRHNTGCLGHGAAANRRSLTGSTPDSG